MLNRRTQISLALAAGLALLVGLTVRAGLGTVLAVLQRLGGMDLVWLCAMQLGSVLLCGLAWWTFTEDASLVAVTAARFVKDGASSVLAIVPGVGEAAGMRALTLFGAQAGHAAGSGVVDILTEIMAQFLFTLIGIAALVGVVGGTEAGGALGIAAGTILPLAMAYAGIRSVRIRAVLTRLARGLERRFRLRQNRLVHDAGSTVVALWQDRPRLVAGTAIHLSAWMLSAVQVWYAAGALAAPLSPLASLALAAMVYAARGALFVVPWGAGVQEFGFVVAGVALGLDEPTAIALSLAVRVRDVLLAVPALLLWGAAELREAWLARRAEG